jgi:hypothetical protein
MFGWIVGTGPGAGFGLLILICGIAGTLVGISGYLVSDIRNVDVLLPDYRAIPPVGLVRRPSPTIFGGNGAARDKDILNKSETTSSPDDEMDEE